MNKLKRFVLPVAVTAASCLAACNCQTSSSLTGVAPEKVMNMSSQNEKSEQAAIQTVKEQLGLSAEDITSAATQSRLDESVIPGLGQDIAGETAWEVHVDGVRIRPPDSTIENAVIRKLAVMMCPSTGHVMKIRGPVVAVIPPGPPAADELAQMQGVGESFSGFPESAPKITFLQALDKAFGNAASAKEITAYYVQHTIAGAYQDRPVWIIHLRGIPPIPPSLPPGAPDDAVPDKFLDHTRSIIDAETGEFLIADSIPQPK